MKTTWSQINVDDTIVDRSGNEWSVTMVDRPRYRIVRGTESHVLTNDPDAEVERLPSLEEQEAVVEEALPVAEKVIEEEADTATRKAGGPYPIEMTDLQLRSHLFLVHGISVAKLTDHDQLHQAHKAASNEGIPHVHEL